MDKQAPPAQGKNREGWMMIGGILAFLVIGLLAVYKGCAPSPREDAEIAAEAAAPVAAAPVAQPETYRSSPVPSRREGEAPVGELGRPDGGTMPDAMSGHPASSAAATTPMSSH